MNMSSDITNRKMSITRASKLENIPYEEQAKFVNDRLVATEESLSKICTAFSLYVKKLLSLRDATDNLALVLHEYASEEKINRSSKNHILQFSEQLASVGDFRDIEVKQLDSQILKELSNYHNVCLNAKTEVKNILNLKEKELNKRKQLQKIKNRNPYNRERIIKAEATLSVAVASISRSLKELEEHIRLFEDKKLQNIKSLLMKFITIEIAHHSNSIQLYSDSFKEINKINIVSDLHDFEEVMKKNISDDHLGKKINHRCKETSPLLDNLQNSTNKDNISHETYSNHKVRWHQQSNEEVVQSDTDFSATDSFSFNGKDISIYSENK